jgi:hypothetical protein
MLALDKSKENRLGEQLPSINRQPTALPLQRSSTAFSSGDFNEATGIDNVGPGSYEVSRKLGTHSNVFKNAPIITIPKSTKTNKLFISKQLSSDLLGSQSPGSGKYSPSTALIKKSGGSAKIGTDKRVLKFMAMHEDSSPGPIYSYDLNNIYPPIRSVRGSLPKAAKCKVKIENIPAAGVYNPKIPDTSPAFKLKGRETSPNQYLAHLECTYRGKHSPGPAIYSPVQPKNQSVTKFSTMSKEMMIRNI